MPIFLQTRRMSASGTYLQWPWASVATSDSPSISMLPRWMVSRWIRQRRKVLLPDPEGPMTASTSPLSTSSETPLSTSTGPKRLCTSTARIIGLFIIDSVFLFQTLEAVGQHQGHEQIKGGSNHERHRREIALNNAACRAQQVVHGQHINQRGVLDQRDGLVAHRRQDALENLRQHDAAHGLGIGQTQYLGAFVLATVNGLDTGAEDFRKIGRVVQHEGEDRRRKIGQSHTNDRNERQGKVDEQHLQHQRRTAHQPDIAVDQATQKAKA